MTPVDSCAKRSELVAHANGLTSRRVSFRANRPSGRLQSGSKCATVAHAMTSIHESLFARYAAPQPAISDLANETFALLLNHRSVRAFLPEPLDTGVLEGLAAAAQSASTSSHLQAWSVIAVEDPAKKARLADLAGNQQHVREAPLFMVWLADLSRLRRISERMGESGAGLDYLESFVVAAIDASLAAQNAVIAAESQGLGVVYIGAIRNRPLEVAAEIGLPRDAFALFGLCVGRPDPARPTAVKPRLPQSVVLHRERYGEQGEADAIAAYDKVMEGFYCSQGLKARSWSGQAAARVKGPESLSGRDRLREALGTLGFKLD